MIVSVFLGCLNLEAFYFSSTIFSTSVFLPGVQRLLSLSLFLHSVGRTWHSRIIFLNYYFPFLTRSLSFLYFSDFPFHWNDFSFLPLLFFIFFRLFASYAEYCFSFFFYSVTFYSYSIFWFLNLSFFPFLTALLLSSQNNPLCHALLPSCSVYLKQDLVRFFA